MGLLWSYSSFHGASCDRVCPALKVLWWKCLCAKSSINIRSRPGCGVSRILPMLAIIKGSGHRKVGNGGGLPIQWFSKAEMAFLLQLPFLWLTLFDRTRPILPSCVSRATKTWFQVSLKRTINYKPSPLPTPSSWPTIQHHPTAPPGGQPGASLTPHLYHLPVLR